MPFAWAAPSALARLARDAQAALDGQRRLTPLQLGQRLAVEELHDDEGPAVVGRAEVGDVDDVLVADRAGQPRLLQQPRDEVALGVELLEQHLHGDALADQGVARFVDGPHAAFADPPHHLVAAGQHDADQRIELRVSGRRQRGRRRGAAPTRWS